MNSAFYSNSIKELVDQSSEAILGHLAKSNPFALDTMQRSAWLCQIEIVRKQVGSFDGWIAFEFAIPRMGKRADALMVTAGIVFVFEFKVGSDQFEAAALDQVVDYALDLKNFHAGSHDRRIVPIVLATAADNPSFDLTWQSDGVASSIKSNGDNLRDIIERVIRETPKQLGLDGDEWSRTGYKPTPTIISWQSQSRCRRGVVDELDFLANQNSWPTDPSFQPSSRRRAERAGNAPSVMT
jgi:hypothetical protein